jgi:glutathione S-transferase
MTITLTYWDVRGIANPIRFMLAFAKADFVEKPFIIANAGSGTDEDYFKVKPTLPLDFPNLPFLIDGDNKITQVIAICRYLGRKFNLLGQTESERITMDIFEQQMADYRKDAIGFYYRPGGLSPEAIAEYIAGCNIKLDLVVKFLEKREFATGKLTYVDFFAYETLAQMRLLSKELLTSRPTLNAYLERIENLPGVKEYISSDKYIKWPVTAPHAHWGNKSMPYPG